MHDKSASVGPTADTPPGEWPVHSGRTREVRLAARQPLNEELRAFVRCIRDGSPSLTPGEDGARVLRVLDAAQTFPVARWGRDSGEDSVNFGRHLEPGSDLEAGPRRLAW